MGRKIGPEEIPQELERASELLENGAPEDAVAAIERVLAAGPTGDDLVDAHLIRGDALLELGRKREALAAYEAALALAPDDPAALEARGEALFELWDFDRARESLEAAVDLAPERARAHRYLALALDRTGQRKRAEKHFRKAHDLDGEAWALPVRVERAEFDRLAREAIDSLPGEIEERLGPIGFLVEDYPRLQALADRPEDADPQTLGVFFGEEIPRKYEGAMTRFVPNHILLFQRNLEQYATTRNELAEEIRTTVYHEIGHYLGYGEEALEALGLA